MIAIRIEVFDVARREWRWFDVVPHNPAFKPVCGNGLHQCAVDARRCACGAVER